MISENKIKYVLGLLIVILVLVFIFKAEWLTFSIATDFPSGTLISWLLIAVYALFMFLIFKRRNTQKFRKILTGVLKSNVLLAVLWGIVSFLLSGNWSFNFDEGYGFTIWIWYTAAIILTPFVVFVSWATIFLFLKFRNSK